MRVFILVSIAVVLAVVSITLFNVQDTTPVVLDRMIAIPEPTN